MNLGWTEFLFGSTGLCSKICFGVDRSDRCGPNKSQKVLCNNQFRYTTSLTGWGKGLTDLSDN
jgi:hypothetical protein